MHTQNPSPSDVSRDNLRAASETAQVLIAGGGPTGLWLSCELALQGVPVTVLEQLARPTGRSKALGLHPRTMEMLDHRGILSRFTDGNPTPPFVNFGMLPLDLRTMDFPTFTAWLFRKLVWNNCSKNGRRNWVSRFVADTK